MSVESIEESPKHEDVDAAGNAIFEHFLLASQPLKTSETRAPQLSKRFSGLPFRTSLLAFQTW